MLTIYGDKINSQCENKYTIEEYSLKMSWQFGGIC